MASLFITVSAISPAQPHVFELFVVLLHCVVSVFVQWSLLWALGDDDCWGVAAAAARARVTGRFNFTG